MKTLVIDLMGGDNGSKVVISAIKRFLENDNKNHDFHLVCVGEKESIKELENLEDVSCIESKTVIKMDEDPFKAIKDENSSLMVGIKALLDNDYDGIISSGSTGALLTAAMFKIKRIEGISRPGLITTLPTVKEDKRCVMIDLGANLHNSSDDLVCFAHLASLFYKIAYNTESPKVYQLNNGTEAHKGKDENKETYERLSHDEKINFLGNIEGRDCLKGEADVIITDGFSGNIFLKTTEGSVKLVSSLLKDAFKTNLKTKIAYLLMKKEINKFKNKLDYKKVGGAMLLGVNKLVVKAHGSSDDEAFYSALKLCSVLAIKDLVKNIKESL